MTRKLIASASLALLAFVSTAQAQQRFTADLRLVAALPTSELTDSDLGTGLGIGATIAVRVQPHLHVYGGWDWIRFSSEQSVPGTKNDFEETGYTFGLRFEHPLRMESRVSYRLEAGGVYKHTEIEDEEGELIVNSGHGLGYEVGAGLLFPLSNGVNVTTTLRWRARANEFEIGNIVTKSDLNYAGLEVGLSKRF
jgi:hypothetical protein